VHESETWLLSEKWKRRKPDKKLGFIINKKANSSSLVKYIPLNGDNNTVLSR